MVATKFFLITIMHSLPKMSTPAQNTLCPAILTRSTWQPLKVVQLSSSPACRQTALCIQSVSQRKNHRFGISERWFLERVMGIEPTWPAWEAGALPLSYTRAFPPTYAVIRKLLYFRIGVLSTTNAEKPSKFSRRTGFFHDV